MKLTILLISMLTVMVFITTAFAEVDDANKDYMHVMFVESSESRHSDNFSFNTITTAIYSPVLYPAIITIYVQDADMTPIGMMMFKTTLLKGITPI